ncbi:MAG: HAD hydrolase-like protein [Legionella sp.]|nr:HAD hydrolase-like protein [Legionella sp.]
MTKDLSGRKIIFFDFDGTIVDTMKQYCNLYNEFAKQNGKPIVGPDDYAKMRRHSFNEVRKKLGLSLFETFFIAKKLKKQLYKKPSLIQLIPEIIDLINELHNKDFLIYIISSNTKNNVQNILTANKVQHIEHVISTFRGFEKTYFLKKYLRKNKEYRHAYVVSDEYKDIKAANRLGLFSIAVTWGANDFRQNQEIIPKFIIDKPSQLLTVIAQLEN